ncbi:MAG: hypothetical protein ABII22_03030 [Candidatus Micrarchaeota archaeon]
MYKKRLAFDYLFVALVLFILLLSLLSIELIFLKEGHSKYSITNGVPKQIQPVPPSVPQDSEVRLDGFVVR